MPIDQDELLRMTGQVEDRYLEEAALYQPKRKFWKTALGIVIRRIIDLLIIMFLIFLAFWFVEGRMLKEGNSTNIDDAGYVTSAPGYILPGGGNP